MAYDDDLSSVPGALETIDSALVAAADALRRVRPLAARCTLPDEERDRLLGRTEEVRDALNAAIIAIDESGDGGWAS